MFCEDWSGWKRDVETDQAGQVLMKKGKKGKKAKTPKKAGKKGRKGRMGSGGKDIAEK